MGLLDRYSAWKKKRELDAIERTRQHGIEYAIAAIEMGPDEIAAAWRNIDMAYGTGHNNAFDTGAKETLIRHGHVNNDSDLMGYTSILSVEKTSPEVYTNNILQFPKKPNPSA